MAFGFAGAAAGAQKVAKGQRDELAEMLAAKRAAYMQDEQLKLAQDAAARAEAGQRQEAERFAQRFALDKEQFDLQKTDSDFNRTQAATTADWRAEDRRAATNKNEVRRMSIEGLRTGSAKPRDAQLMAAGEGVDIPADVLDPERESRQAAETDKRRHGFEMQEIAAQGAQQRQTQAARPLTGLSPAAQTKVNDNAAMIRVIGRIRQMGDASKWRGVGPVSGPLQDKAAGVFGSTDTQSMRLRAALSNLKGDIVKERGGTALTPTEEALIDRYAPTIGTHPDRIKALLDELESSAKIRISTVLGGGMPEEDAAPPRAGSGFRVISVEP
jgi:hypothetical protein